LLNELRQIKELLHSKLMVFKARSAGKRTPSQSVENGQFEIVEHASLEDILRKEIDHFFVMTQVLNTVVLRGDETYRTMQELAKLTNDQDQVTLDQLVKRLQNKFQMLLDENQNLTTEKELKLIPRIEQLLRENAALRNGSADSRDFDGLLVKNEYLQDQVNQMKRLQQNSFKSREEKADLLLQIDQLRDEREDLL